ncbi:hypothetical protein CS062_17565 [Roseateles chitinivorans]|uniref:Uncharacterized protein n=1 Tax=Roseateles chitinivorans TaxID=2917965 RepID=A0A2G9C677_9BURK|nr:hypothetical protein CS062_17565 [Roseateles chitinivorans]
MPVSTLCQFAISRRALVEYLSEGSDSTETGAVGFTGHSDGGVGRVAQAVALSANSSDITLQRHLAAARCGQGLIDLGTLIPFGLEDVADLIGALLR